MALASGVFAGLSLAIPASTPIADPAAERGYWATASGPGRTAADRVSRSQDRSAAAERPEGGAVTGHNTGPSPGHPATATPPAAIATAPPTTPAAPAAPTGSSAPAAPPPPVTAPVTPAPTTPAPQVPVAPVAGLSQTQMRNAKTIVRVGVEMGLPKRAYVIAVACALQESNLLNLASTALAESYSYPHEGSGSDHDSVGLFQQRPSAGWGTVRNLMSPEYATRAFYQALIAVPGWSGMALTYAAQAVQVSAYPLAYAKHERRAQTIVDALT